MLLEARGGGEGLPAVWAGVGPGAHVLRADVSLQVAGVREHLGTQTPARHILSVAPCGPRVRSRDGGLSGRSAHRPAASRHLYLPPQQLGAVAPVFCVVLKTLEEMSFKKRL